MEVGTAQLQGQKWATISSGSLSALNLIVEHGGTFLEHSPILDNPAPVVTVEKQLKVRGEFTQFGGELRVDEVDSDGSRRFDLRGKVHWIGKLFRGDDVAILENGSAAKKLISDRRNKQRRIGSKKPK